MRVNMKLGKQLYKSMNVIPESADEILKWQISEEDK